ncbi:hypothetical protein [Bacillus sp. NEB1478]|uniref:hypothetical protein n=1 Tax=Bacillus sp. NEB1478 TaxID=3073816 RepID=UPI0028731C51|nr:hypothetical protein [Bacillus sp. NEB1478]WNB93430.1 hypothetical protein RGB74_07100 [Bacillus sp. NEB1478]
MKKRLSKGELDFIKGCTKAILKNNTDYHHWLFIVDGIKRYFTHKDEFYPENHPVFNHAMCICAVGGEFITDWHYKAGNDDFSKPWIKRSLKKLLVNSESFAENYYAAREKPVKIDDFLESINVDGLSEKGKEEYLEKVSNLIRNK